MCNNQVVTKQPYCHANTNVPLIGHFHSITKQKTCSYILGKGGQTSIPTSSSSIIQLYYPKELWFICTHDTGCTKWFSQMNVVLFTHDTGCKCSFFSYFFFKCYYGKCYVYNLFCTTNAKRHFGRINSKRRRSTYPSEVLP